MGSGTDGDYFRRRAAEVRSQAELQINLSIQENLLRLVAHYNRLAELADKVRGEN